MAFFSEQTLCKITSEKGTLSFAVAFDENYAAHACAMLTSLAEHAKSDAVYEVIILDGGVSSQTKNVFDSHFLSYPKLNLRWVDMSQAFSGMHEASHYSKGAYFRMALPEILPDL